MKISRDARSKQPLVKTTQQAKKPSGKQAGAYRTTSVKAKKQPQAKKSRLKSWLVTFGAIASLIGAGGVIVGGIWLAILLMINPNAVLWLNQFLPEWTRIPIAIPSPPQTLAGIQEEVRKSGLIPGEPIYLSKNDINNARTELLLPILASSPNCQTACEKIIELRVYHPTEQKSQLNYYRLVTQLAVAGPEEYFVLSTPVGTTSGNASASLSLPLTQLRPLEDKAPDMGFWFNLSGQRVSGDTSMSYGQIVHYNPEQMHLSIMLQWTNPDQLQPEWQQVTDTPIPELVVNQTVGLEPRFKVYQIKPRNFVPNPIYLQEISLAQAAINTSTYRNALTLARNGLWSPALQLLQSEKKNNWSTAAQAQLDLIRLHAQVTQSQAKQAWPSTSYSILANLIDGRWADALLMFRASEPGLPVQEIAGLLKADSGGLWDRTQAAIKVNPKNNEVKAWGALILAAQQGRSKAIAWLKQLQNNKLEDKSLSSQINELFDHLGATSPKALSTTDRPSKIVGTAQQVKTVNPLDWLQPENSLDAALGQAFSQSPTQTLPYKQALSLTLQPQQVWYQVQVAAFNDGQRWWQAPYANLPLPKEVSANQLWNYLGLENDPKIQIRVWTDEGSQESTIATVKAVSYQGGAIQVLAAGEPLSIGAPAMGGVKQSRPLAYTDAALRWLEPGSITFTELNQLHPQWVSAILPAVWRELLKSGQVKQGPLPNMAALLNDMGHWSVQIVELTGDNEPELLLTLYEDRSGTLKKPDIKRPMENSQLYKPRTLILSNKGALLYSEFSNDADTSLTAIADLGDGGPTSLIVDAKSNYGLKRWSAQRKRFE